MWPMATRSQWRSLGGERDLVLRDVTIRVRENYILEMHIDTDEANAAELGSVATATTSRTDVDDDEFLVYTGLDVSAESPRGPSQRLRRCLLYTSPSPRDS